MSEKENKSNGIIIETEKCVNDGIASRHILGVKAKMRHELPETYYDEYPYCALHHEEESIIIQIEENLVGAIKKGETYNEEVFQKMLDIIKKCAERYSEIAKNIRKLEETWKGKETFII